MPISPASDALPAALQWIAALLLGQLASAVAIIAFAGLGYAMLQGRISARTALRVMLGSFLLFGAPTIAAALVRLGHDTTPPPPATIAIPVPPPLASPAPRNNDASRSDPYAGASLPM